MQHGNLEELASKIAHCVRCGKCKPDCCVFFPARNLFFHPRNKNLAIGSLIEAVLFEAQRNRNTSFELLKELEEIADHCTICHKCEKPCPVKIDTGEISILERNLLNERGIKHTPIFTKITLKYLSSTSAFINYVIHTGVLFTGMRLQNLAHFILKPFQKIRALSENYIMKMMKAPMPLSPYNTLFDFLPECNENQALVFEPVIPNGKTYFYFPGCGSERMFPEISMSAIYLMLKSGAKVIIPPRFLCCGFPMGVNGKEKIHNKVILRDTIIFSQIRDMFKHLNFDAVAVTCGTCKEALTHMGIAEIFETEIKDVMALLEYNFKSEEQYLYHKPCHDSLEDNGMKIIKKNIGENVKYVPHCCSEAGTLALSRPDITDAMRSKKSCSLEESITIGDKQYIMLTNCPSCIQGLNKQSFKELYIDHLVSYVAKITGGKNWKTEFKKLVKNYERVNF